VEIRPQPSPNLLESLTSGGEPEIDEAVGLAGETYLVDKAAFVSESGGIGPPFVAEHVTSAEYNQRGWEAGDTIGVQWRGIGVSVDVIGSAVSGPVALTGLSADDEAVEFERGRMDERTGRAGIHQYLPAW
jgi:hypothetical protein